MELSNMEYDVKVHNATLKSTVSMMTVEDSMPFPHFGLLTDNRLHPGMLLASPICLKHEDYPDMITTATKFKLGIFQVYKLRNIIKEDYLV